MILYQYIDSTIFLIKELVLVTSAETGSLGYFIKLSYMDYYRRNLPHWQPQGAEFFVTFRLAGSLPKEVITHLKEKYHQLKKLKIDSKESDFVGKFEAKIFRSFDDFLDKELTGPMWLSNNEVAKIVVDALHFYDQTRYDLYAFTIMSNHVHFVFRHLETYDVNLPVTSIMKNIKSYTAKEACS